MEQDLVDTSSQFAPVFDYEELCEELEAKDEYERNMEDHQELEEKMKEEEHNLLQQNYVNYYDQISITLKCYGDVRIASINIQISLLFLSFDYNTFVYN